MKFVDDDDDDEYVGLVILTVCTLSKFVEIQMINRISKKIPPHTHVLSPADLLDWGSTKHVSFEVTVPSTLIVTN